MMKISAELPRGRYSQRTLESMAMFDESEVPLDVIVDLVQHIHAYEGDGAILIFLSGWEEISAVRFCEGRRDSFDKKIKRIYVIQFNKKSRSRCLTQLHPHLSFNKKNN